MIRPVKWRILVGAVAYAIPLLLVPPLHALEARPGVDCAGCDGLAPDSVRLSAACDDGSLPCSRPHHHHQRSAPHHPGKCQVCSSLALGAVDLLGAEPPPLLPPPVARFRLPDDLTTPELLLTPESRGPPPCGERA